ncbi:MAG: hypothetical protein M3313_05025, partial [Actinomycetota bacterium]|nr:hypothetical protein [Actinomycetota bacterium]
MADQPAPPSATPPAVFDPGMATRHPLRILLAEDNQINLKLTLHLLGKFGYQADVAGNGVEALAALEGQHYDFVLMERAIAWVVAGGNRRLRYRGVARNHQWLLTRTAALNPRRLINLD